MAKSKPLVSVIIPAYKAAHTIGLAIESILGQTYQNLEVIIIDDRSPDTTWEVINKYAAQDKRIRPYQNDVNMGVGGNRARGIELAKGEFICWQDADDISMPDRIESQLQLLLDDPNIGVVGGYLEFFGEGVKPSIRKYAASDADLRKTIFRYNPVAQPASMFRKECFDKLGGYDPSLKLSEDLEMFFRVGTKYTFANIQKVAIKYRQDASSLTHANLRQMEWTTFKLRLRYARNKAYRPGIVDCIYNLIQFCSMILPSKTKVAIFNKLRNSSNA